MSNFTSIDQIVVKSDRQRQDNKNSSSLQELKRSILTKGLLHAPVVSRQMANGSESPSLILVAGERRLLAMAELHHDGLQFTYNSRPVEVGQIPFTLVSELTLDDLEEAELEENILRADLTWQEEMQAKLKIHELRQRQNPDQTIAQTAAEIAPFTGFSPATEANYIARAQTVIAHLDAPNVKGAKSLNKAHQIVLDKRAAELARDLRRLSPKASPHHIINGDFREVAKTLDRLSFDVLISDPPYGINADQQSFQQKHEYQDSKKYALELYQTIFREGFKLLKPQGTVFLFCDIEHFVTIRTFAEQQAFSTWRTPIIWQKGNEGPAPWGKNGFIRTFETILYAVKGQRPLALPGGPDVRLIRRSTTATRAHAAEKPPELLRWLLQISCSPGCRVLDPCAGSAPIITASKDLGLSITCIEQNEEHYKSALTTAARTEEEAPPESVVQFPKTLGGLDDEIFGETVS